MEARQLVPTGGDDGRTSRSRLCQPVKLPANGVLVMSGGEVITLSSPASYTPACAPNTQPAIIAGNGVGVDDATSIGGTHVVDLRDPFFASTFPQCYALAATTVVAYTLVIMLVITPRSFLDGGVVVLGRRGFTSGGSGSGTIGGRPWLQKVAALTVAISLTIATSNTYRMAEEQYASGYQDARQLQDKILNGTELKIIRIISDTFLWLAQAQTLIRLFPRQREKVIIKWTAFALITLDLIFDSLNSFHYIGPNNSRPGNFKDAIPALSYVFQLALGVLYAAWVIYYSLMKKKYAYYHPQMKNICLVAILSLFAILVPVVFFILDIAKPEFTGWGDYVRWVGAAAASVIVWEWVERIEALEREEKRDGILGREVFDGDEMLEPPSDSNWPRRNWSEKAPGGTDYDSGDGSDDGGEGGIRPRKRVVAAARARPQARDGPSTSGRPNVWPSVSSIAQRYRSRPSKDDSATADAGPSRPAANHTRPSARFLQPPLWPSRPPPAATPVSRTDTASADSTVYAIRYHPLTETTTRTTAHPTPPPHHLTAERQQHSDPSVLHHPLAQSSVFRSAAPPRPQTLQLPRSQQTPQSSRPGTRSGNMSSMGNSQAGTGEPVPDAPTDTAADFGGSGSSNSEQSGTTSKWRALGIPLVRRKTPVSDAEAATTTPPPSHGSRLRQSQVERGAQGNRWDLRTRIEDFAATQADKIREKIRPTPDTQSLPVTVIPAPPRRGAALAQLLEEEESQQAQPLVTQSPQPGMDQDGSDSPRSPARPWRRNSTGSASSSPRMEGGWPEPREAAPLIGPTAPRIREGSRQGLSHEGPPVP
ncbi:hypothetical protein RB594_001397 [Gaeumannomyces avenae]